MDINRQILHRASCLELDKDGAQELVQLFSQVTNWQTLIHQAELYAVANMLLKHISEHDIEINADVQMGLKGLSLRHRKMSDVRYQVITEISDLFLKNDIPLVALKGLALAPMIYPEDRLRPMRDMDILVPKEKIDLAADLLRQIGFNLPEQQSNKYMRDSHQLPNATKKVDGFLISVEVHHDAFSRDVVGHLRYEDIKADLQTISWREIELKTLGHEQMLHQISTHLEGLHPGAVLKLINVIDVVAYAERFIDQIDWQVVKREHDHILNTLKCLHLITPLSEKLQQKIGGVAQAQPNNIGEIMKPLTAIFKKNNSFKKRLSLMFNPSDWWLHLYYNTSPDKSLWQIKYWRHPIRVATWLWQRLYSRARGG